MVCLKQRRQFNRMGVQREEGMTLWFGRLRLARLIVMTSLVVGLFTTSSVTYSETTLRHCTSTKNEYILGLIELALSYSEEKLIDGRLARDCTQMRQLDMLQNGGLDFMWAGTTRELEEKLIPIRVPVYKGLMGHRVFLVKEQTVARLESIDSLAELQQLTFGQGASWSDTAILKYAGFKVRTGTRYNNMFDMLLAGRYDVFPRAAHEIWREQNIWQEQGVTVDTKFMLVYPMPAYIFISPKKPELAEMLKQGFNQALDDGSFDKMFYQNEEVKAALAKTDFPSRKVFYLENPFLSGDTPLDDSRLWLDTMAFFLGGVQSDQSRKH